MTATNLRTRRTASAALGVLLAVAGLGGCDELGLDPDRPFETASFKYVYAVPDGSGGYTVTQPNGTACPGTPATVSLALLAGVTQARSDFHAAMVSCGGTFLVAGDAVHEVRDNGFNFRYRIAGSQNDALIRVDRLHGIGSSEVDPAGFAITTSGGLTVGERTTLGFADVHFADPARTFTCEHGGPDWTANVTVPGVTFFEIELTDQDEDVVDGRFQCIARNQTDASDARLLLALDGAFSMVPR